ncbi:MAG: ABC transporter substrate-binding protein [Anaerolineaceae bacterium]|nr:ABC transporter substrate-binding protein [Anaerolineaceae bacterium]
MYNKTSGFWLVLNLVAIMSIGLTACGTTASAAQPSPVPTLAPSPAPSQTSAAPKPALQTSPSASAGKLSLLTWWTSGNDLTGLNKLIDLYKVENPGVALVNGVESNVVSSQVSQIQSTDTPDVFQFEIGRTLENAWVSPGKVQTLDDLYASQQWSQVFPKGLLDILNSQGHYYSVPVDIQRTNLQWYNTNTFQKLGILRAPVNFADWLSMAAVCQKAKIPALALGDADPWALTNVFETVLIGNLGAQGYKNLWAGSISWYDPKVTAALNIFKQMMSYVNPNHAALTWQQAEQMVINGQACTTITGDWVDSYNNSVNFSSAGWAPAPNNAGVYDMTADTFVLPVGAASAKNGKSWLALMGSQEGQMAWNTIKGSNCARTDCDPKVFDPYLQTAISNWKKNSIVPSLSQGAATDQLWLQSINKILTTLVANQNLAVAQANLEAECKNEGVCK